jgi:signal peptidase II
MTRLGSQLALLALVLGTVGCDRITKHLAVEALADLPRQSFLADTVRLEFVENRGAFLGLGSEWPEDVRVALFVIGNSLLLALLIGYAIRYRWSGPLLVGACLFAAGGVSNLADRVARGSVIDFLNVGVGPLRTGIFNVADMAILAGALIVAVVMMSAGGQTPAANASDASLRSDAGTSGNSSSTLSNSDASSL